MNRDEVVRLARECGDWNGQTCEVNDVGLERFAELVAAAERQSTAIEMERLRGLAATAEKWRGIASAKFGDGRTVQEIQREAAEVEREECAKVLDANAAACGDGVIRDVLESNAVAIRARVSA